MSHLPKFILVGGIGFIIDAGGLYVMTLLTDWNEIIQRIPFFIVALLSTFALNSAFTFQNHTQNLFRSFCAYLSTNAVSQGFNFAIYSVLVLFIPFFTAQPVAAVFIGSAAAASVTYMLSKYWVFKAHRMDL